MENIIDYYQPIIGLIGGVLVFSGSCYMYWWTNSLTQKKIYDRSSSAMKYEAFKAVATIGMASSGIAVILAIKFLSS